MNADMIEKNRFTDLQGQVERITYSNPENGYTIAKVKIYGRNDAVTVVGNLMTPTPGEILKMTGEWVQHPKYGEQFKVNFYASVIPATVYGIRKYLGSGLIKGVGPIIAERIVSKFGAQTLDVIESNIDELSEVNGIGKKRVSMIRKAWEDHKEIREVMLFLQSHGVSSGYAAKIFKQYGKDSVSIVRENPYRLATDIYGIGFITADRIAEKLGIPKDSPIRADAGVLYVLQEMSDEGHVYYPYEPLIQKCCEILSVGRELIAAAIAASAVEKKIILEDINESLENFRENNKAVYLEKYHTCETRIAQRLKILNSIPKSIRPVDADKAVQWVKTQLPFTLAEKQTDAIRCAISSKVMVITGGPGTGKTTIITAILKILSRIGIGILLAAPTGRAAKRMNEATGFQAKTIHRLLEYSNAKGGFQKNSVSPLRCDLIIVDEASMIDTVLMHHFLKAVPNGATVIFVGDVNQLPSVGPGNVLNDMIDSETIPVVKLDDIFRQAKQSQIIINAHKINKGHIPYVDNGNPDSDFYFIEKEEPEAVLKIIAELIKDRIPKRFGFDPITDIQIITPMHRGVVGSDNLNTELQNLLNPGNDAVVRGMKRFRVNDKVMQIKNNYDKEVYNGDIGKIIKINNEDQELIIQYDGRDVPYDFSDLDEIALSYAISVHKAQGSEYPAVIFPIVMQHYMLLQRNLIYTAVTRGKHLAVMVGTKKALAIGVKNDKTQKRYTHLRERLK